MNNDAGEATTYEKIMGIPSDDVGGGATALSARLAKFRQWLVEDAKVTVHPSLCIVNGEATDGTKNAPVLLFGPPPEVVRKNLASIKVGRCGMVDKTEDQALYDRTMGCQVRAAREIKKEEVLMTVPRSAMITPDVIAASDAGRAVLACCRSSKPSTESSDFWDVFENTPACEKRHADNIARNNGTQMLVKILQDRKKAEATFSKVQAENGQKDDGMYELAAPGTLSTRAPVLAFLIQQRFSNQQKPPIVSEKGNAALDKYSDGSALRAARRLDLSPETPDTFGPYARTLPSSVAVPICWKRNELAQLAACIPGISALQEVTSRTALLAADFITLCKAGLLQKFPEIFPPGVITWERWVWAAAVFDSRVLPVSCYLDKGEENAESHIQTRGNDSAIQSSPQVWDELGVMIPLQDMLNHETEAPQVTWEPPVPEKNDGDEDGSSHPPRAMVHKRVKKGSQLYATYGLKGNQHFITQYGFALVGNKDDDVKIGWALGDAVGNVSAPSDYSPPTTQEKEGFDSAGDPSNAPKLDEDSMVYDSIDPEPINQWWTDDRLSLLEKEAVMNNQTIESLKSGKKLTAVAYGDGSYHPILLSAAVIGTMPPSDVTRCLLNESVATPSDDESSHGISLSKSHQEILRNYLQYFFCRKMEKLLQNLNNGLKDHFGVQLWTKVSEGGLHYKEDDKADTDGAAYEGWQTFFDSNAYTTSMECENRYYAIASDSCVLALYDGHVRALQAAIDGTMTQEAFEKGVLQQLKDLGFVLLDGDVKMEEAATTNEPTNGAITTASLLGEKKKDAPKDEAAGEQNEKQPNEAGKGGSKSGRRRNRRRNGGGGDRPPAIKLHVGNLAYTTKPGEMFEYFANLYGRDNILECHIPTERDTGRSRGFGFVTFPEAVAIRVLQSDRKHQISGRLVKVAESNSTGGRVGRGSGGGSATSDRCPNCGYRPRYCVCSGHGGYRMPPHDMGPWHPYGDDGRPPPDYLDPYGPRGRMDRGRRRSRSRSPSYRRSGSRGGRSRDRDYSRDYDRDYDRDYYDCDYRDRGSRSYSRGGDRGSDRGRRDRDRSRERSRERSRGRSRRSRSRERPRSRDSRRRSRSESPDRSRSRSGERSSRRDRKDDGDGGVKSPGTGPSSPSDRKRDSTSKRSRSRSRSRGRSGKRRKSSKKEGSRRHRSRSNSRSRSPRTNEE